MFTFSDDRDGTNRLAAGEAYSRAILLDRYFRRRAESSIKAGGPNNTDAGRFELGSIIFGYGFLKASADDPKVMVVGEIKGDATKADATNVFVADNPGLTAAHNPYYSMTPDGYGIKIVVKIPPGGVAGTAKVNCALILDDKNHVNGEAVAIMAGQEIVINAGRSVEINAVIETNVKR